MEAYKINNIYFEQDALILILNDQKYLFKISEISEKLANADDQLRNNFIISPSGYGIHWPGIDEDLSISGLLNQFNHRNVA